jgi:hypothetical protein
MSANSAVVTVGSAVAIGFGTASAAISEQDPARLIAIITAIGGLITAIGAQFGPMFRLWIDNLREERAARMERHELANKLHLAGLEIESLKLDRDQLQGHIDDLRIIVSQNRQRTIAAQEVARQVQEVASQVQETVSRKVAEVERKVEAIGDSQTGLTPVPPLPGELKS